jgi:hypothetical protein
MQSAISHQQSAVSLTLVALSLALAVGCAHGPEQILLEEFFGASRLRDRTALQAFATVPFDPHVQGVITSFSIAHVSPDDYRPLSELASEIGIAELSLDNPLESIDVRSSNGEMVSKEVTIQAPVRLPNGQIASKTLNIILQRAILKGSREVVGRWIVTGVVARES